MLRRRMSREPLIERYLLLGLRLGKLVPGLVDAYYGPPELSAAVDAEQSSDPAALAAEAAELSAALVGCAPSWSGSRRWRGASPASRSLTQTRSSAATASGPRSSRRTSSPARTRRSPSCCPERVM